MKILFKISLFVATAFSLSLNAQTINRKTRAVEDVNTSKSNDVKATFIKEQNYLYSANAMKDYKGFYGDSLNGFNEAAVKADLLSRFFLGGEVLHAMNNLKREFIWNKYKIGPKYALPEQQYSQSASRPGSGGNTINLFPCVNEDFELTTPGIYNTGNAVAGWTIQSGQNSSGVACNINSVSWTAGSPEFSIMATPILGTTWNGISAFSINNVTIPQSPLGGNNIARLQDSNMGSMATRLRSTFPVTSANTLYQFAYAGSWDGTGHACCDQPSFNIRMYNCPGAPLVCSSVSLTPSGNACTSGVSGYSLTGGISWTNWVVNYIDLTPFIGTCVTIEVVNSDCDGGAHHGTAYFDFRCGGSLVGIGLQGVGGSAGGAVSFCAGANMATIQAPLGYSTYQWYGPNGPNPPIVMSPTLGGNTPILSIPAPISGAVYTVGLITASGCSFTAVDTLAFTNVSIIGIGTTSSCPGGASGSSTVQGNGSGTGYSYTWTAVNSTLAISSLSYAANLLPGTYSVNLTGLGASGCGSAAATVTVGTSPPNVYTIIKPFCGNMAYLSSSGSNFQWYEGIPLAAVSNTNGGNAAVHNIPNPFHGQIVWLTYTSPQGCRDSVQFVLNQTPAGSMYVQNINYACPNQSNGTAQVVLIPASGSPSGINSFSVWSAATPAYTSYIFPTAVNGYTPLNMPAGTYSVNAFDGSCNYSATFVVPVYNYDYNLTPVSSTLCPGNTLIAGISFTNPIVPGQYNFNWNPSTWIVGGPVNASNISIQIAPVIPPGSVATTIYTVTVVPTIVNCPITKTISVTSVNLAIPTIISPNPFCTNASAKTITVTPAAATGNYTFSTGNNAAWLNATSGVITPGGLINSVGTNTFLVSRAISTCVVSNSSSFDVSKFNPATITGTLNSQCVTNPCTNLMNIVASQVNGAWANTPGVSANVFCPTNLTSGLYTLTYNTTSNPDPNLCPDSKTISVSVSQTVTPFITPVAPFCTNRLSFGMNASPTGGTWSGGPPLMLTPAGIVNPFYALTGNNVITYVVVTGACINTATTVLNATTFQSAALTNSVAPLCYFNSAPVNLMNVVQYPVGYWTGQGTQGGNYFDPLLAVQGDQNPAPGGLHSFPITYHTASTPNPIVCPDHRDLVIQVLVPITPTITQPRAYCNVDAPFQIQVSPNTGSFTPTVFLSESGIFVPALCPVGNNMVQYTTGTSTCSAQDSKQISIEAFIPATIIGSIPEQCSTNSAINLATLTINSSGNWTGQGMNGSTFNPGLSGTGNIILSYNTSSYPSGLCPATETLAVKVYSLAIPVIDDDGPYCNSKSAVQLRVTPLGGLFSGENNHAVDVEGRFNPTSGVIGDNIVNYSITSGPCLAYARTVIKVEKFISADFLTYPGPFCKEAKPYDLNIIAQNPGGDFSNKIGSGVGPGGVFDPGAANPGNNNIIFYATHSMPTASLCPDTSYMRIQVNDSPTVQVASNTIKGCSPVEVVFSTPGKAEGRGEWTLGDGSEPIKGLTVNHTYTSPGTYTVVFNYWDELGCTGQTTLEKPVVVYDNPKASFSYGPYGDDLTISDPEVQFTNLSSVLGENTYQWQIDNLYSLPDVNPTVTFPKIGKYQITLLATSIYGCKDKTTQTLEIKNDFGIYIPNSFTPNEDGVNDVFIPIFTPYGLDAKTFEMEIFDRWGVSLYRSKDVTKGWNGTVQNKGSEVLKYDTYIYKIKYKDIQGNVYNKVGNVNLLR